MAPSTAKTPSNARAENDRTEKTERARLQLEFTPQALRRLEEIRLKVDARSNAEVVRSALRLYEWFIEQTQANAKILVAKGDDVREVELLFDR